MLPSVIHRAILLSLMLVASAFEARSVTASAFTVDTFNNCRLNWTAAGEIVLAVLITHMDAMRTVFGTVQLTRSQWALAFVPAVVLILLWEVGKLIARRR